MSSPSFTATTPRAAVTPQLQFIVPAVSTSTDSTETEPECRGYAATVHRAVAANGLSGTDFILGAGGEVTTLEINTNAGLGPRQDLAQAFAATGLAYDDLIVCQPAGKLPRPGQR